jgi:hypothetical protein
VAAKNSKMFCYNRQPGCELPPRRWGRCLALAGLAIFAPMIFASCDGPGLASNITAAEPIRLADSTKKVDLKDKLVVIRCKVCVLELPINSASTSEELWNYLDQERVQCLSGASLPLNGMRVGIGRSGNWPEISGILNRLTGKQLKQISGIMVPNKGSPIVLKDNQPEQTIFLVNADQTLSGADYPPGKNLLTFLCTINQQDPGKIMLTAVPQISTAQRNMSFEQDNSIVEFRPEYLTFSPLTFRSVLSDNDIVVVGPSSQALRDSSLGHHFLIGQKDGVDVEILLVLIPELIAQPVGR